MGKEYQEIHREIIELSKAGNEKAMYELYSLYAKAMFNICLRMMNNRENAEDALQDGFCNVFDKIGSFRGESSFGAWVKRIMVNTCMNLLEKKRPGLIFTDEIDKNLPVPGEEDEEELHLSVESVKKAISLLPDGYRLVLNLYLMEGYDHTEISEILGISESTSRTQYMKARNRLKEILKDEYEKQN